MNPYVVLGVPQGADEGTIKRAFRNLSKKYHPDSNPGHEDEYIEVQKAYEALKSGKVETFLDRGVYIHKSAFTMTRR